MHIKKNIKFDSQKKEKNIEENRIVELWVSECLLNVREEEYYTPKRF